MCKLIAGLKSEEKITEVKHYDMISLYYQVQESAAMNENSKLWSKLAQNYDKDIQVYYTHTKNLFSIVIIALGPPHD